MSALKKQHDLEIEFNFQNDQEKLSYLAQFQCVSCKHFTWRPFQFTSNNEICECICQSCLDVKLLNPNIDGKSHFQDYAKIKRNLPDAMVYLHKDGKLASVSCGNCNEVFLEEEKNNENEYSSAVLKFQQKLNAPCARNSKSMLAITVQELSKSVFDLTKNVKEKDSQIMMMGRALKRIENRCTILEEKSAVAVLKNPPELNGIQKELYELSKTVSDESFKLTLLENTKYDGKMIWKIDDVAERLCAARSGKVRALHSGCVYVGSREGYKYCLRLYLNGDGMGRVTHLSLFLVLMKSEFDALLEWPFVKTVKTSLLNQMKGGKAINESMTTNNKSTSWDKPTKHMNIAAGFPYFAIQEVVFDEANGFLKDDCLFISCEVCDYKKVVIC